MIQLEVLSGRFAGQSFDVADFPCTLGRSAGDGIRIEEPGIWERHLTFTFEAGQGVTVTRHSEAMAVVNDKSIDSHRLQPGDFIDLGALKLRFWLSPVELRREGWRENLLWIIIGLVVVVQIGLLFWLL